MLESEEIYLSTTIPWQRKNFREVQRPVRCCSGVSLPKLFLSERLNFVLSKTPYFPTHAMTLKINILCQDRVLRHLSALVILGTIRC